MSYTPTTWSYTNTPTGEKIYDDQRLNIVQENLKTLYDLIDDLRINANNDLLSIQNNVNAKTVTDPRTEIIGLFASKMFEALGVFWPNGTPAGIIATILGKLISASITIACKEASGDSSNDIQREVNDIKNCMNAIFTAAEIQVTHWRKNMQSEWDTEYTCNGDLIPEMKGKIKLSDLGESSEFFPKKGESEEYVNVRNFLTKKCNYLITKDLLPIRWKIWECYRAFPEVGFADPIGGWQVAWYKVYNHNTWDKWRSHPDFPNIPNDLRDDIEGPYEDIEKGSQYDTDSEGNRYYYQFWYDWAADGHHPQPNYPWSKLKYSGSPSSNSRWMNWGGRYCSENNPLRKDGEHNLPVVENNNIKKGTPFLDFVEDILAGKYFADTMVSGNFPNQPSYFLWYSTKRPNEGVEIVNDKRNWTLIGNDSTKDWEYDSNSIFTWGRAYRGIKLRHYYLVDQVGNHAPKELCDWLFSDNGHGTITNPNGIAGKIDVYHHWGLSKSN